MGLFDIFKSNHSTTTKVSPTNNKSVRLLDFEHHLSLVLDIFMNFKDSYLKVGDRLYLSIGIKWEDTDYSTTYYTKDYYIELKVYVSDWWDCIMYEYQDVADMFESVFNKKKDENTFICDSVRVASTTCCTIDWDAAIYRLHCFIDEYETKHPGVMFDRSNGGVSIKFGDR